jgi:UDP-galactopyranose mutase
LIGAFSFAQKRVRNILINMMGPNVIIVGAGFAGAVCARELAEAGKTVLVIEKRNHIGGNVFDELDKNGILVQRYGPHIFHTNRKKVIKYLKNFQKWEKYEHSVLAKVEGKLVPIPFNFASIDLLFGKEEAVEIKTKLLSTYSAEKRISVFDLLENEDVVLREFGKFIYEKIFAGYTSKQWGTSNVEKSVIERVPIVMGYDNRYFQDRYQHMPSHGFTVVIRNLFSHPNIQIRLNEHSGKSISFKNGKVIFQNKPWDNPLIYTGPLDELYDYRFGDLPYRSLDLVVKRLNTERFQSAAVVINPNEGSHTRVTEFKLLSGQDIPGRTTILKEYPLAYDKNGKHGNEPFYPVSNKENREIYKKYKKLANATKNLYLCGRLAEYRYYDMDDVISRALTLSKKIIKANP